MRTVILAGLIYIGDAIAPQQEQTHRVIVFYALLLIFSIIMDIADFVKN